MRTIDRQFSVTDKWVLVTKSNNINQTINWVSTKVTNSVIFEWTKTKRICKIPNDQELVQIFSLNWIYRTIDMVFHLKKINKWKNNNPEGAIKPSFINKLDLSFDQIIRKKLKTKNSAIYLMSVLKVSNLLWFKSLKENVCDIFESKWINNYKSLKEIYDNKWDKYEFCEWLNFIDLFKWLFETYNIKSVNWKRFDKMISLLWYNIPEVDKSSNDARKEKLKEKTDKDLYANLELKFSNTVESEIVLDDAKKSVVWFINYFNDIIDRRTLWHTIKSNKLDTKYFFVAISWSIVELYIKSEYINSEHFKRILDKVWTRNLEELILEYNMLQNSKINLELKK